MYLKKIRDSYLKKGYTMANCLAKICQDILLYKISKTTFNKHITIKGGVVMHNISGDKRRATRDIDIDFIKYSLDDDCIIEFINKLNMIDDGIKILIEGKIKELKHQDYSGKRVNIKLIDKNNFSVSTKLDIGVHKQFLIEQDEFCFNFEAINDSALLLINSKEQIIAEKLKSLLKIGIISTRYKDIFDFYYLINETKININKLLKIIDIIILDNDNMSENNYEEVLNHLQLILNSKKFRKHLDDVKNNWINIPSEKVIDNVIDFFENLIKIKI